MATIDDTQTINGVRIGNVIVDEDTGEILDGELTSIDHLLSERNYADEQVKAWTQRKALMGMVIDKWLSKNDLRRLTTEHGTVRYGSNVRDVVKLDPERVARVREDFGISDEQWTAVVLMSAKECDAKKFKSWWSEIGLDARALHYLVTQEGAGFLTVDKPRRPAPKLDRATVEA